MWKMVTRSNHKGFGVATKCLDVRKRPTGWWIDDVDDVAIPAGKSVAIQLGDDQEDARHETIAPAVSRSGSGNHGRQAILCPEDWLRREVSRGKSRRKSR